ncbi:bifunctional biotin--[acetyl-CoA-carboxylase] ligase/biotin operon repressor BirA [Spartinivicinus poritis]|uniref:Bifunctional ligase/repressor BirA n=1 Tax=Spartinivicinus poritis TaxID=2994640 RepID=A0ABT5UEA6_9GAMM|nr:bifunctional biotin--[acetyl-CoA-carboxylase] ligase/biotin operon repressor BirA [Spartinivicinus sp. A2-2]MDE1464710.1 bifunctional biotin--[acetyl-CoA-carboxylase] ligase/biotin operon repressor BirA [Spartinivicinus sp. A2-2]
MDALLKLLADGQFHSGDALGKSLGVSRAAVWKQLKKLQEWGLELQSVKGKGYRLGAGVSLLSQAKLEQLPQILSGEYQLRLLATSTSTNDDVQQFLKQSPGKKLICMAEYQASGRGRQGKQWVSPFASNLYMTLSWPVSKGVHTLEGLSLVVGLALAKGLSQLGINDLKVKWPNDLYWRRQKLAGILIEIVGDLYGSCTVIIGVGLNVMMPSDWRSKVSQQFVDLASIKQDRVDRNEVALNVLKNIFSFLDRFTETGFSAFKEDWAEYDACLNQPVKVIAGESELFGVARGVEDSGALIVEMEDGQRQTFSGGEVSLRPL